MFLNFGYQYNLQSLLPSGYRLTEKEGRGGGAVQSNWIMRIKDCNTKQNFEEKNFYSKKIYISLELELFIIVLKEIIYFPVKKYIFGNRKENDDFIILQPLLPPQYLPTGKIFKEGRRH